jgi:hypothetical protein
MLIQKIHSLLRLSNIVDKNQSRFRAQCVSGIGESSERPIFSVIRGHPSARIWADTGDGMGADKFDVGSKGDEINDDVVDGGATLDGLVPCILT